MVIPSGESLFLFRFTIKPADGFLAAPGMTSKGKSRYNVLSRPASSAARSGIARITIFSRDECALSPTAPRPSSVGTPRDAVKFAPDLEPRSREDRAERAKFLLQFVHVCGTRSAQVDQCPGVLGDYVRARAALNHSRVYGNSATRLIPLRDPRNLKSDFFDCVDSIFWIESRVGRAPGDDEFDFPDALAAGFYAAIRS